jgi:hypothetical protein
MSVYKLAQIGFFGLTLSLSTLAVANSQTTSVYTYAGIWTGNNNYSSAPSPICACDADPNSQDCPLQDIEMLDTGDVCYDEFIPDGSNGWVHAGVFQKNGNP